MRRIGLSSVLALLLCASAAGEETVDNARDADLLLRRRELIVNAEGLYVLKSEGTLATLVSGLPELQKGIPKAAAGMTKFQKDYKTLLQAAGQSEQQYQAVNNQLKGTTNAAQKTQLSQMLKEVGSKRGELLKQVAMLPQHHNTYELTITQSRKAMIDGILAGKKHADDIKAQYVKLGKDPLVVKALKMLGKPPKQEASLGPGAEFSQWAEKLKMFEDQLIREEIELEAEGKTLLAEIVVNGKQKVKFQVFPVATRTQISDEEAKALGAVTTALTPTVPFNVTKEERIKVPELAFPSLELGELKSTFVRVAIIPKEHAAAHPTLGANFFLGRVYQFDTKAKKLKITRLKE